MSTQIKLHPQNIREIRFSVIGTSPYIQHAWSSKGLNQMRMTAQERKKVPKVARDPEAEAKGAMYTLDGKPAFPLLQIKAAMVNAAHKDIGLEKTMFKKSFFIPSDNPERLIEMECSEPIIREDIVRVGRGATDLRYRPEFQTWRVNVIAHYDADNLNAEDIINLVNRAGFGVGVGDWRPEKGGEFGRFKIDTTKAVDTANLED
jgi:hypothetical protein